VDVYEATRNLYVECERYPSKWKLYGRARRIKERDQKAKFAVAVQDRMGWFIGKLQRVADAVWVVSRSSQVQTWQVGLKKENPRISHRRYTLKNLLEGYRRRISSNRSQTPAEGRDGFPFPKIQGSGSARRAPCPSTVLPRA